MRMVIHLTRPAGGDHDRSAGRGRRWTAPDRRPDFPIGIFWPPPPDQTTQARYQEIRDAGFTFVITGNYLDDGNIIGWALQQADQVGLKVLISDDTQLRNLTRWFTISDDRSVPMSITTADGRTLVQRALDAYGGHPSFAGFNMFDEPWADLFPTLGRALAIARSLRPTMLPYTNLPPDLGFPPGGYQQFVEQFIQTVQPALLSFDRYPILSSGLDAGYFSNWATIRQAGLNHGLPTWTFIQSVGSNTFRATNGAEMLWLINVSLAYGAKGIQYFTYWTPDPARGEGFGPAIIDLNGRRTERYRAAQQINTGWLSPVGRQLKPLVSEQVVHFNDPQNPGGVTPFAADDVLSAVSGDPVIIGRFRSGDPNDRTRWLLVVNRQYDRHSSVTVSPVPGRFGGVSQFDARSQNYRQVQSDRINVSLDAGAAALYRLS
ncbi:hypothetical protein [Kutzneria kofuensis]|uniref:hypothetical protein n=1 Tax=Kutzneria kofuensis TaxID=103725 RepID=UPI0031E6AE0A